ncbi:hypothetical protein ACJX0J_034822, partial [Zea mays]
GLVLFAQQGRGVTTELNVFTLGIIYTTSKKQSIGNATVPIKHHHVKITVVFLKTISHFSPKHNMNSSSQQGSIRDSACFSLDMWQLFIQQSGEPLLSTMGHE